MFGRKRAKCGNGVGRRRGVSVLAPGSLHAALSSMLPPSFLALRHMPTAGTIWARRVVGIPLIHVVHQARSLPPSVFPRYHKHSPMPPSQTCTASRPLHRIVALGFSEHDISVQAGEAKIVWLPLVTLAAWLTCSTHSFIVSYHGRLLILPLSVSHSKTIGICNRPATC